MRSILIHAMNFWPEPTGIAPFTTTLAEYLDEREWKVSVLTAFPHAPSWKVYDGYRRRVYGHEKRGNIDIYRTWIYVPRRAIKGKMKVWKRIAYDTSLFASGVLTALTLRRHDVIVAVCPPLQTGFTSLLLSRIWNSPILYWVQDIVPDAAVSTGMLKEGFVLRLGRQLEHAVYRGVDKIGIISLGFLKNLESKGVSPDKLIYLPNWADMKRFDEGSDGRRSRKAFGYSEADFVILHAGSVSAKHCMENAIHAMRLLEGNPNLHLVIVGDGNRLMAIKALAARLRLRQVRFEPIVDDSEFVDLLRAADLLLLNQATNVKDSVIPSKLMTYLPSARPVVAAVNLESEAAKLIAEAGCGVLVEPENPELLAKEILRLSENPQKRAKMAYSGLEYIRKNFDRSALLNRFETHLLEMIKFPMEGMST